MFEVAMMTYVSTPSERERGLQAAGYTVEYRDCWVLERAAQSLPTLNLSTDLMPVIHKRNLAAGASMAPFEAWKTRWPHAPTTCADWNRQEHNNSHDLFYEFDSAVMAPYFVTSIYRP